ncbi:MAG: hypothetical protein AB7O60_12030 [Variibacter sp.]
MRAASAKEKSFQGAAGRDFGGTRFWSTPIVFMRNHEGDDMLDLVKVAVRKRRDAQNV